MLLTKEIKDLIKQRKKISTAKKSENYYQILVAGKPLKPGSSNCKSFDSFFNYFVIPFALFWFFTNQFAKLKYKVSSSQFAKTIALQLLASIADFRKVESAIAPAKAELFFKPILNNHANSITFAPRKYIAQANYYC